MTIEEYSNLPDTLVIEFREELRNFNAVVTDISLPIIDIDVTLQLVIDSIQNRHNFDNAMMSTATQISMGESLMENDDTDNDSQEIVFNAVMRLGNQIKNKLVQLNAYSEDYFPYIFRRMLNANDAILTKQNA